MGSTRELAVANTPSLNTWYAMAVDRSGSTLRMYVDGSVVATSATYGWNIPNKTGALTIGIIPSVGAWDLNGWIDELRITKGVARYAGAYTPATAEFPNTPRPAMGPMISLIF